jgi:autotransporter strand-loop-strand O-heptosyltransferase
MSKVLVGTGYPLGDVIAMLPYVDKYAKESGHEVYVQLGNPFFENFFKESYPNMKFSNGTSLFEKRINVKYNHNTTLQAGFAEQLGFVDPVYLHPKVDSVHKPRTIKNKYCVIGIHATAQLKYWNHPGGVKVQSVSPYWADLCFMLRKAGITPIIVEKDEMFGVPPYRNGMPKYAQKKIGVNLIDTINLMEHAEFFIGLSSGLTWLAHGLNKKVAMISNFSEDWHEIAINDPDYVRITNTSVCHGCWNKVNVDFPLVKEDWYWCPLHKDTPRQFECHTSITPTMVFNQIKKWI